MAEIILADLLEWMPALAPVSADDRDADVVTEWLRRPISWAVAARAGTPMLPAMRGGEVVVVSPRILTEQPFDLVEFATDLVRAGCAAMALLDVEPADIRLGFPWIAVPHGLPAPSVEGEINRLLTEQRGLLYSRGTELGRALFAALGAGAEPAAIARVGAEGTGIPMVLVDSLSAGNEGDGESTALPTGRMLNLPVGDGKACLAVGPVPDGSRALAALAGERVGEAIKSALRRADLLRPRGPARAAALRSELVGESRPGTLLALGLSASSRYRVAIASDAAAFGELDRIAGSASRVHEAGEIEGAAVAVVEWLDAGRAKQLATDRLAVRMAPGSWLVLSEDFGLDELAGATGQARFTASLLADGDIAGPVVAFDGRPGLGTFRLLYRLRDDPELARFVEETLGDLRRDDKRGVLRETLRAYLAAGGAGVETAARLGIHRNTLAYRLRRIAALTGRDPGEPEHWLAYGLALAADRLAAAPR